MDHAKGQGRSGWSHFPSLSQSNLVKWLWCIQVEAEQVRGQGRWAVFFRAHMEKEGVEWLRHEQSEIDCAGFRLGKMLGQ